MIASVPAVLPEAPDLVSPEVTAVERRPAEKDFRGELAELVAEPARKRYTEPHLPPPKDLAWKNPAEDAPEKPFPPRPDKLVQARSRSRPSAT
jgi:hypothetical protein